MSSTNLSDVLAEDTIVALASPVGASLVGIVRLSGPQALQIVSTLFACEDDRSITHPRRYSSLAGELCLAEHRIPASLYLMPAPYSYTRQDVAEVHMPGAPVLLWLVVEECLNRGARLATRGEFTRRALLNGRIDLNQAEAVLKIIQAEDADAARLAARELEGGFSRYIHEISAKLFKCVTMVEAAIDFSDQDIELVSKDEMDGRLLALQKEISRLADQGRSSKLHSSLPRVAICGLPNVGKSSLFNVLLGAQKAIVTSIPGTTRDVLEGELDVGRLKVMLFDSAGLAPPQSRLEQTITTHSLALAEQADLILFALDASKPISGDDEKLFSRLATAPRMVVLTKVDLPGNLTDTQLREKLGIRDCILTSALARTGIDRLKSAIRDAIACGKVERRPSSFLLSLRQRQALRQADTHIFEARQSVREDLGEEFVALDLREALDALGQVSGKVTSEDVLDEIFSRFCIGK